jgi:hypothetical protein
MRRTTIILILAALTLAIPAFAAAEGKVLNVSTYQGIATIDLPQTSADGSDLQDLAGCEFWVAKTSAELDAMFAAGSTATPQGRVMVSTPNPPAGAKLSWTWKGQFGIGQWYMTSTCIDLAMNRSARHATYPFELADDVPTAAPTNLTNQ